MSTITATPLLCGERHRGTQPKATILVVSRDSSRPGGIGLTSDALCGTHANAKRYGVEKHHIAPGPILDAILARRQADREYRERRAQERQREAEEREARFYALRRLEDQRSFTLEAEVRDYASDTPFTIHIVPEGFDRNHSVGSVWLSLDREGAPRFGFRGQEVPANALLPLQEAIAILSQYVVAAQAQAEEV